MPKLTVTSAMVVAAIGLLLPAPAMATVPGSAGARMPSPAMASVAPGSVPAKVNPKYLVCDPNEWPGANPKYPFSFLLTTKYENTSNPNIRAAVKSIQRVIDYRVWGDQLTNPVFVKVDGRYGPKTAAAIRKFQKANKITVDGKVGKQTWRVLAGYCGSD